MARKLTDYGVAARLKSDRAFGQARALRKRMTPAEKALWLRACAPAFHFRKQTPIGPFIVDFAAHGPRLIVELDGAVHSQKGDEDRERQIWLEGRGYRVLRFHNAEVVADVGAVTRAILEIAHERQALLTPPPCGEG